MEDGNPKIAALKERQRRVEEERTAWLEERKVLNFHDRKPYVRPEDRQEPQEAALEGLVDPQKPEVDEDAIETLEAALEHARKGGTRGVIILSGMPTSGDHDVVTDILTDMSISAADNIQIFLGGLETTKADLFALHSDLAFEIDDDEE